MREHITLDMYEMGRSLKFQDEWVRAFPNAVELLGKVNAFLDEINWDHGITVTSGFRPTSINRSVRGSAKHSLHCIGKAVDIDDSGGIFRNTFNPLMNKDHAQLLRKYGLFMEHPDHTPTWVHLDIGHRVDRPTRTFVPA